MSGCYFHVVNWCLFYRSDNTIKNHWHSIAKHKPSSEDLVAIDASAFEILDPLLSCTPSQNGGLVGVQPVRLFNTPKMVSSVRNLLHFAVFLFITIYFISESVSLLIHYYYYYCYYYYLSIYREIV